MFIFEDFEDSCKSLSAIDILNKDYYYYYFLFRSDEKLTVNENNIIFDKIS